MALLRQGIRTIIFLDMLVKGQSKKALVSQVGNPTLLTTLQVCDQPGEICALSKSHHSILVDSSNTAARDLLSSRPIEADRPNVSHNVGSITHHCAIEICKG